MTNHRYSFGLRGARQRGAVVGALSIGQLRAHLKRGAADDAQHDRLHGVVLRGRVADDAPDDGHVHRLEAAAERVDQQLLRDGARRTRPAGPAAPCASATGPSTFAAVGEHAGRVDRRALPRVDAPPLPDGVEVLEREAHRIDVAVARARTPGSRDGVRAAREPSTADPCARSPEIRHDGRRRQRRRVQQVRDDVLPAQHGRRAIGDRRSSTGCCRARAGLRRFGSVDRHATEARAVDAAECRSGARAAR